MRIIFYASEKAREQRLAAAFATGARRHGHVVLIRQARCTPVQEDADLACMVGVKSRLLWRAFQAQGVPTLMFDKGYSRHKINGEWEYWRVAYNAHQPQPRTLQMEYPPGRLSRPLKPWRKRGDHILIAGSSAKYHEFYGLLDPTEYVRLLVSQIRRYSGRPIVYRPKPSWKQAVPVDGTIFSHGGKRPLAEDLKDCHVLVTHGSNACFDAAREGIPSIVVAGVTRVISSTSISEVERPRKGYRPPLFNALAYHQWTLNEMASGKMFNTIGGWF